MVEECFVCNSSVQGFEDYEKAKSIGKLIGKFATGQGAKAIGSSVGATIGSIFGPFGYAVGYGVGGAISKEVGKIAGETALNSLENKYIKKTYTFKCPCCGMSWNSNDDINAKRQRINVFFSNQKSKAVSKYYRWIWVLLAPYLVLIGLQILYFLIILLNLFIQWVFDSASIDYDQLLPFHWMISYTSSTWFVTVPIIIILFVMVYKKGSPIKKKWKEVLAKFDEKYNYYPNTH